MSGENRIAYVGVKRQFDPTLAEDLLEYKYFLDNQRWQHTCPFICEPPWEAVPFLIEHRIVQHTINDLIKKAK